MPLDVSTWLHTLGLGEHAPAFAANDIDDSLLPGLSDADLKELGVASLGQRKKLLAAIAALSGGVSPAAQAPVQRRQATILFADLCGFTELCTRVDPEDVQRLCERFYALCDPAIVGAGGRVDKHLGDGVMALFGAPVAHGDDSLRALRAALALHQAAALLSAEFRPDFGQDIELHIGISLGEVVAGGLAPSGYTVLGDAVNLASRLVGQAGAGETVVSDAVARSVGPAARFTDLGLRAIKGIEAPQPLWRLESLAPQRDSPAAPLVGRSAELAQLNAAVAATARTRRGGHVLLRGEPGIGKTRLVEELRRHALATGFVVVGAQALDFGGGRCDGVLAQWLAALMRPQEGQPVRLDTHAPLLHQAALAELLGQPLEADPRSAWMAAPEPAREAAIHTLLTECVERQARRTPTLLIAEDLHWADNATLRGLAQVALATRSLPVLLLGTSRGEGDPLERGWREALAEAPPEVVSLGPLPREDATTLAQQLGAPDSEWLQACVERAGGNPLFLDQLMRHASEGGGTALPASLRSLVTARVDRLGAAEQAVLRAASVLGQRFDAQALFAVLGDSDPSLQDALRAGLLRADGDTLGFGHALLREGIYLSLLREQRSALHRAAAAWYAGREPALRAEHLERAGDPGAALAYAEAAEAEREALRTPTALALTERGLALQPDAATRGTLLRLRGAAQLDSGQARAAQDSFTLALALLETPAERRAALLGLAGARRLFDDLDGALAALDQAEPLARAAQDWATLSALWHQRGNLAFPQGRSADCLAAQTEALALAERAGSPAARAAALGGLGDAEYARGHWVLAGEHFSRCVAAAREAGQGRTEAANWPMAAMCRIATLDVQGMAQEGEAAMARAHALGLPRAEMIAAHAVMLGQHEMGHFEAVEPLVERAQALARAMGAARFEPENLIFLADALAEAGDTTRAQAVARQALERLHDTATRHYMATLVLATAARLEPDARQADAHLAEAQAALGHGGLAHNTVWLHRSGMAIGWRRRDAAMIEHHAAALEQAFAAWPMPWTTLLVERGRVLAAALGGPLDIDTAARLAALRALTTTHRLWLLDRPLADVQASQSTR